MDHITESQQALVTVGIQSATLTINAQKQNNNPKPTNTVFKQAVNSRTKVGSASTYLNIIRGTKSTRMSAAQSNLSISYLGPCRPTARRVDLSD